MMIPGEPLIYARVAVLILFGTVGLIGSLNVYQHFGWGAALLSFGCLLCLIWIALK